MRRIPIFSIFLLCQWNSPSAGGGDVFWIGREMASRLEARAQELLDRTVGLGQARVLVSLELDVSRVEEVRIDGASGNPRARARGERGGPTGRWDGEKAVPGISRRTRRTLLVHPRIVRLSAVLLVNRNLQRIAPLAEIRSAIGFSQVRGDRFVVTKR